MVTIIGSSDKSSGDEKVRLTQKVPLQAPTLPTSYRSPEAQRKANEASVNANRNIYGTLNLKKTEIACVSHVCYPANDTFNEQKIINFYVQVLHTLPVSMMRVRRRFASVCWETSAIFRGRLHAFTPWSPYL